MAYTFQITVSDEEYQAFNLIVPDADEWVDNAVRNKIRKCMIYVAERTAEDTSSLDQADLDAINNMILAEGAVMKQPKHWSDDVKKEIVKRTKMKTRAERDLDDTPSTP